MALELSTVSRVPHPMTSEAAVCREYTRQNDETSQQRSGWPRTLNPMRMWEPSNGAGSRSL
jgi:hypothetical protein